VILVDASYFIGVADAKDRWHRDALRLRSRLRGAVVVSAFVLAEVVTVVGARRGGKAASVLLEYMTDNCRIEFPDAKLLPEVAAVHLRYDGTISFADAHSIYLMESLEISQILSFDADFDKVTGIERVH
jgi:predicted nucleic acid-binding protein